MEPNQKPKRKYSYAVVISSMVAAALGYLIVQKALSRNPPFDDMLVTITGQLNKNCPTMVDQYTRLDNTIALPNKTLGYNYTLLNSDVQTMDVNKVKAYLQNTISNSVKTSPDLSIYRDNDATLSYSYKDSNGVFLFKIEVGPNDYK